MIPPILAAPLLGIARWVWLAGAVVALVGVVLWLNAREKADDRANQELGATVQRETDLRKTIERTETANEAREEIARPDAAGDRLRYDQCLRTARTPANCQRFLPGGQTDQR
jgi:hypothetical protein